MKSPGRAVAFEPQRGDSQPQVLGHGWTDECVRGLHRGADRTFPKLRFRRNVSIGFGRSLPMIFCRKPISWRGFGGSLPMTFCLTPSILNGFGDLLPMTFGQKPNILSGFDESLPMTFGRKRFILRSLRGCYVSP